MKYSTLISTDELAAHIDDASFVIVDCRHNLADVDAGERAYRDGRLPGARFMHIDRDLSGPRTGENGRHPLPDIDAFATTLSRAGIDAGKQVVAYDQNNGMWASRLWWLLRWMGHDAVAVLDGGIDKWKAEGRRVIAAIPPPAAAIAAPFRSASRGIGAMIASADEILRSVDGTMKTVAVLDARAAERFRGDIEPIDRVAGHIPGALNRPYMANLSTTGTFKPAGLLRAEYLAQLGDVAAHDVVHQCGSGVTACHNVLAMEIAGLPGSRLYPGSWSEWIADPKRPIARGT